MARIKLTLPDTFIFKTEIPVRISDINYGNHLSNDAFLTLMHEARMQFLKHFGYTEMNMAGVSLIMADAAIVFKKECFYGDVLIIEITAAEFGTRNFDLYYRFTKKATNELACEAKTGMVCFDYNERKTTEVPEVFKNLFA
ncbi:MAG: thioesterase family protein [Bacteroidota bacterium]